MSDSNNTKSKARGGGAHAWTEHELVYILTVIEYDNTKLDFANAPAPSGRTAHGCSQKIFKIKNALRAEIDAIKNGEAIEAGADTTPKKSAGRKRKAAADVDGESTPKKRGRAKKNTVIEPESESEIPGKYEPEEPFSLEVEAENNFEV